MLYAGARKSVTQQYRSESESGLPRKINSNYLAKPVHAWGGKREQQITVERVKSEKFKVDENNKRKVYYFIFFRLNIRQTRNYHDFFFFCKRRVHERTDVVDARVKR